MTDVSPKQMGRLYIITKVHSSIKCQISIYTLWPLFGAEPKALIPDEARLAGVPRLVLVCDSPLCGCKNIHHAQISALHHLETRTPAFIAWDSATNASSSYNKH